MVSVGSVGVFHGGMVAGEGDFRQWEDGTKGGEPEGRKGREWVALDRGSCRASISGMIFAVT